jgi:general secretion pathway protein A
MYEKFFGFAEKPFSLLPDAEFLYFSENHKSAYNVLEYSLTGQAGFTIITGEVGSGKTTLVQTFLKRVGVNTNIGLITNTPRSFDDLMKWVLLSFGLDYEATERVDLYRRFTDFLITQNAAGRSTLLIVDEAQNLGVETLEELRMLSNVNVSKNLLLQIVLVGQPELLDLLNQPELRQFAQRISMSYQLSALTPQETQAYIRHRLAVAGGDPMTFTGAACDAVFHLSKGVPRLINGLCDVALVYGFGEEQLRIDVDTVLAVYTDRSESGLGMGTNWPDKERLITEISRLGMAAEDKADVPPKVLATMPSAAGDLKGFDNAPSLVDELPVYPAATNFPNQEVPINGVETTEDIVETVSIQWKPLHSAENQTKLPEINAPSTDKRWQLLGRDSVAPVNEKEFVPVYGERRPYQSAGRSGRSSILRWILVFVALASILAGVWFISIGQTLI